MPRYRALGQWHEVDLIMLDGAETTVRLPKAMGRATASFAAPAYARGMERVVNASTVLRSRMPDRGRLAIVQGRVSARPTHGARRAGKVAISSMATQTLITQTVIAEGLRQGDFAAAKQFGATVLDEGLDGKILLRVDTFERVFELVDLLLKRDVGAATPNFIRKVTHLGPSRPNGNWSHGKIGVAAAWAITRGRDDVSVAVLDEGVDTSHPALKQAVVAERDFIGNNGNSAMPAGNDAHGTACAGIVVSRDKTYPGIAPRCSLIAARIAMDDGDGNWVFDDFATADAIDWCWHQGASVLSNSWGGGAPSDAISRALGRARTQGRGGLGSVVAIAAGNDQGPIHFPGDLPGYVTVGASDPADQRKTRTSSDGENWGSSHGPTMHVLAPGVFIWTTDISGPAGYDPGDYTKTFNGTSSATPAVAAAAALMISANPALSATRIRNLLATTAKRIAGQSGWTPELGWGRLDVGKAVAAAKASGAPAATTKNRKKPIKRRNATSKRD